MYTRSRQPFSSTWMSKDPPRWRTYSVLSRFTLNQLFFAIDRLSREGKIILQQPTRFAYLVSSAASGARAQVAPQPIGRNRVV